ncbi:MAG TPA: hypothetical protein VEA69_03210 [Tepidisphaeraceae bacterium]|nr:hypothetical protein [Tepidisphaeraceae bacterium]
MTDPRRRQILRTLPPGGTNVVAQFRGRWSEQQNRDITAMLTTGGVRRHGLGIVTATDGAELTDLRGSSPDAGWMDGLPEPAEWPLLDRLDLSYADLDAFQLSRVRMRDCRLTRARLGQFVNGAFERCDFSGVTIERGLILAQFTDCRFVGADLRGATIGDRFVRCDFSAADLTGAAFDGAAQECVFDACKTDDRTRLPS